MHKFNFQIDPNSRVLKFQQLIDAIIDNIRKGNLKSGDPLPSVNTLIKELSLSRDTIFKTYAELRRRGIVESIPNKGYFVANREKRVLLFLDTLKAYKEVLYSSFKEHLPEEYIADINFHHYNIDTFESVINNSVGKYDKYIIMSFDHERVATLLSKIDNNKLTVIDWNIYSDTNHSTIYQDFENPIYNELSHHIHLINKYDEIVFIYPEHTYHPYVTVESFEKFCLKNNLKYSVTDRLDPKDVVSGKAFVVLEDIDLGQLLEVAVNKKLILGTNIGILSYNDTPMKKFIMGGITVISTDFYEMGKCAAMDILSNEKVNQCIPSRMIVRDSL